VDNLHINTYHRKQYPGRPARGCRAREVAKPSDPCPQRGLRKWVYDRWTWSDTAKIANNLGHYLNADLGTISPSEFAWACAVVIASWIADAAAAYCISRLFGAYLGGRIFTGDAAAWLERVGVAGLIAVLVSIVGRRAPWLILTSHAVLALSTRLFTQFVVPGDLLEVLFCLFVLDLGHVFRTAVQIADDCASTV
jgi:Protein of unknown function (DUF2975)